MASSSHPTNEQWIERLRAVECPDSSYLRGRPALVFDRAIGSYIYDVAGKEYIDLCAGFGVTALGHHDPVVVQRMREYLSGSAPGVMHAMGDVYPSRAKIEFLEALHGFLPKHLALGALALGGERQAPPTDRR